MKLLLLMLPLALFAAEPKPTATETIVPLPVREVEYGSQDMPELHARVRFSTVIMLPESEKILDFICGDQEFWQIEGAENFAWVKPSKQGAQTSVHLVTASGNVYSFLVTEGGRPDLRVNVKPKGGILNAMKSGPRFVPASAVEGYRREAEEARDVAKRIKEETAETIAAARKEATAAQNKFREQMPGSLSFDYQFKRNDAPFHVEAIYSDGKATYIKASPRETPALYEMKDGKPSLVQFEFRDGLYRVGKVIDHGYLSIGKKKQVFYRR